MTIRRDDLVAAASLGLLQYREVDPLLVFLLQRDVRAQRQALHTQAHGTRHGTLYTVLSYLATFLAVVTAILFAIVFTTRAVHSIGIGALFFFTALYSIGALLLAAWFRQHGYCRRVRTTLALVLASVPCAVFALQQVGA
jgi:hypothetical protein